MVRNDNSMDSSTFSSTHDGTHITYISDMVEKKEKGLDTLVDKILQSVGKRVITDWRDCGHYTLMVARGEAVKFLNRNILERQ